MEGGIAMKHNYNIFTKQELVNFMQQNESNYRYMTSPFDVIIEAKMDAISARIYDNLKASEDISAEYKRTKDGFKYMNELQKNVDEWGKLNEEYDRLEKLRFSKEVAYAEGN